MPVPPLLPYPPAPRSCPCQETLHYASFNFKTLLTHLSRIAVRVEGSTVSIQKVVCFGDLHSLAANGRWPFRTLPGLRRAR